MLNEDGKPVMPCEPVVARLLLKEGEAKVERINPFTIRLNHPIEEPCLQDIELGVDDGFDRAGIAIVQKRTKREDVVVLQGELKLRNDVRKKLELRRQYRRSRRSKLRYRKPRFDNRMRSEGWIPPSVKAKKNQILRTVRLLAKIAPITKIVYEEAMFDIQKLENPDVKGREYQNGLGRDWENRRHAVLWRDNYTCQYCGTKKGVLTVDHVIPRGSGGTDTWSNLVCACLNCNNEKGDKTPDEAGLKLKRKPRGFKATNVQVGKTYIKQELSNIAPTEIIFGWETKQRRKLLGLEKTHYNDAVAMVSTNINPAEESYLITTRRRNIRQTHLSNFRKGDIQLRYNHNKSLNGFRKGDCIQYKHRVGRIDSIKSAGALVIKSQFGAREYANPKNSELLESVSPIQFQLSEVVSRNPPPA